MVQISKITVSLMILSFLSSTNQAATDLFTSGRFSYNGSIGYLSGKSKEFVYDSFTGDKISQLNWKINGEPVIKGELNYKIFSWLDANVQGWTIVSTGNVVMDDYDWLVPGQYHWSDWSHHEDTDLNQANEFDLNLKAWFLQHDNTALAGIFGYQRTRFSYVAIGGCYMYNNGESIGCFPSTEKGIGYKQTFSSPYIGIASKYFVNSFEFNGVFKFSNWVDARDVDQHYTRALTFKEGADDFQFYNMTINAGYYLRPQIKLFAEGAFNYFPNKKTATTIIDHDLRIVEYEGNDSAGLNNRNMVLAVGISYTPASV
ncbi:MAG: omptin family outer membrane protease [Legionella sp.]|uniref:omptin family outer membrane protease n=1 Tax=Legionella sp. TaxID=459 RepID=UPI0039E23A60